MAMPKTDRPPLPRHIFKATMDIWGETGKKHLTTVTGNSMLPLIRERDRILTVHGYNNIRSGDVIAFQQAEKNLVHRVLYVSGSKSSPVFVTKGDNSLYIDPLLNLDQVFGKVLAIEREGQYMSLETTSWKLWGRFIAFISLILGKINAWHCYSKRMFPVAVLNRLVSFMRRYLSSFLRLFIRYVEKCSCRWVDSKAFNFKRDYKV
jgi:signal peptidase I